jgi:tetratricopeptide (TPR) repeat protein
MWTLLLLGLSAAAPAERDTLALLGEGDAHYARRAEGALGAVARPAEIERALGAYRLALARDPQSLAARVRMLRALFFRGTFCDAPRSDQREMFDEARRIGEDGVAALETHVAGASGAARVRKLKTDPDAAAIYFWTGVSWGQWSLARGKLAAAKQGAAGKIRDYASTVIALDPELEQGGGYFLLGRLHDQAPWIPLLTSWVSHRDSIKYLRQALAIGPRNTVTLYFLAEAILHHDSSARPEARRLLALCAASAPRPEYLVEDAHYAEMARQRLQALSE